MHSVMSTNDQTTGVEPTCTEPVGVEPTNADVATLEARLKQAQVDLAIAEGKASRAITEAKRWHRMYEHATKPEIRMVAGDDETLARAYVDAQDKCDLLEEKLSKAESLKNQNARVILRLNAYIMGVKQCFKNVSINSHENLEPDLDRMRREGWMEAAAGFPNSNDKRKFHRMIGG